MHTPPERIRDVQRAMRGDPEAFDRLVGPRRSALLLRLAAVVGDWHEAEDALQEALWTAFREVRRLREPAAFDGWLGRIALNAARDRLRSAAARARREGLPLGDLASLEPADDGWAESPGTPSRGRRSARCGSWGPGPLGPDAGGLAAEDGGSRVVGEIARLPPRQRRAAGLAWVAAMPPRDVAETLGASPDALHALLHRARQRLRVRLARPRHPILPTSHRGVRRMAEGDVLVAAWRYRVEHVLDGWARTRPELRARRVDAWSASADLQVELFFEEPPLEERPLAPDAGAIPLDALAEATGLDLEPFGGRLARFGRGGRPYWLPWHADAEGVAYNAELLARAGVPAPAADWTWDDFVACCRRCRAAGIDALPTLGMLGGDLVPGLAEQLGASRANLAPLGDAVALVRDLRRAAAGCEPAGWDDIWERCFYAGGAAFATTGSSNPHWGFADPDNRARPFRWGFAPMPRVRRSDPPVTFWRRTAAAVRGGAADPLAAFRVLRALCTEAAPRGGELPAYRTREAVGAWRALPLPVGKECLLELDAATGPLETRAMLYDVPGIREICRRAVDGEIAAGEAVAQVRAAAEGRAPEA